MKTVYISREAFNELLLKGLHPSFDDAFWESIRRITSWNGSVQGVSLVQVSFRQIEIRDRGIGENNHSIRIRIKKPKPVD